MYYSKFETWKVVTRTVWLTWKQNLSKASKEVHVPGEKIRNGGGGHYISRIDNKNAEGSLSWRNPDTREGQVNISVQNSDTNERGVTMTGLTAIARACRQVRPLICVAVLDTNVYSTLPGIGVSST